MNFTNFSRRAFSKTIAAAALGAPALTAATRVTSHIGHTGITWPGSPAGTEAAVRDISSLGFWGIELFGNQITDQEAQGGLGALLQKYNNLPLISAYCGTNLTDPAQRKASIDKTLGWATLLKKYGGKVVVVGPNNVRRPAYEFKDHKDDIVATLNELGKAVTDMGLTAVLHQHTGTCVESRDETYAVLQAMDTKVMKFGPDIGQLQKGGSDPVQVVKDFLPIVEHMHLKDYSGGQAHVGYCPLGEGKVDIPAILAMMEGRKLAGHIMVELDGPAPQPLEDATTAKAYLQKLGAPFRS